MSVEDEIADLIRREAQILEVSGKRSLPLLLSNEIEELGYIEMQVYRLRRTGEKKDTRE